MARGVTVSLEPRERERLEARIDRRRRRRQFTAEEIGMRDCAGMSELREDRSAFGMHGGGHRAPGFDLSFRVEPRHVDEPDGVGADPSRFGENEASGRALSVIFDVQCCWHELGISCSAASHRSHHDAVFHPKLAEHEGRE
jgi:hypothetical protein